MQYLIMILIGFIMIGIGTISYLSSIVIEKRITDTKYRIMDGKTGRKIGLNFNYDVTQDFIIVPRTKEVPK